MLLKTMYITQQTIEVQRKFQTITATKGDCLGFDGILYFVDLAQKVMSPGQVYGKDYA